MSHYLISFPSSAMNHVSEEDLPAVGASARAVIREAKAAGVYVFGGGIDEAIPPVMVTGEGKLLPGTFLIFAWSMAGIKALTFPLRE